MTRWETPSFVELDMSAEIGGYQGDDDQRPGHMPDFVENAGAHTSALSHLSES